jgi:hypothetical protein
MIPAVIERCAGIDAGKKALAVSVMVGPTKPGCATIDAHESHLVSGTAP